MDNNYEYTYWLFDRIQQAHIPNEQGHSAESLEDAKEQCIALYGQHGIARSTLLVSACRGFEEDGQTLTEERLWECDFDDGADEQVWEEVI
jgi:hypothetical protein